MSGDPQPTGYPLAEVSQRSSASTSVHEMGATSPPAAKRPRTDAYNGAAESDKEENDCEPPSLRQLYRDAHPEFSAAANVVTTLRIFEPGNAKAGDLPFGSVEQVLDTCHPLFSHQLFPDEVIIGYRNPSLIVDYTNPDLRMRIRFEHDGTPEEGSDASSLAPDDIQTSLKPMLPSTFPVSGISIVDRRSGPTGLAAACDFYPPLPEAERALPGELMLSYEFTSRAEASSTRRMAEIRECKLNSPPLKQYHERMATLAMWFIESTFSCFAIANSYLRHPVTLMSLQLPLPSIWTTPSG
jgi:hypothetical protein